MCLLKQKDNNTHLFYEYRCPHKLYLLFVFFQLHENYQEIKGVKHHFDDKEVLNEIFGN